MNPLGYHQPVLAAELLAVVPRAMRVVDATLGDGGHADLFQRRGASVLGIDRDPDAIARARARLSDAIEYHEGTAFDDAALTRIESFRPNLILLDLGVSSRQLDDSALGFSFRPGSPLDMRMSRRGPTAAAVLNQATEAEIAGWLTEYADEPRSRRLAAEIVRRRARTRFETSDDLVNAIRGALGSRTGPADFARIFQAFRIVVNEELEGLVRALPRFRDALEPGGALAAISYHSGEDRIVKTAFREWSRSCICPPHVPVCHCRGHPLGRTLTRRPLVAGAVEREDNPRARSAKLRVFELGTHGAEA